MSSLVARGEGFPITVHLVPRTPLLQGPEKMTRARHGVLPISGCKGDTNQIRQAPPEWAMAFAEKLQHHVDCLKAACDPATLEKQGSNGAWVFGGWPFHLGFKDAKSFTAILSLSQNRGPPKKEVVFLLVSLQRQKKDTLKERKYTPLLGHSLFDANPNVERGRINS